MAPKHPHEGSDSRASKKPRHGFRVGPDHLPDGPWKRKVTKIKKDLIHKAKVKKAYAKIKAKEFPAQQQRTSGGTETGPQLHPERQAILEAQQQGRHHEEIHVVTSETGEYDKPPRRRHRASSHDGGQEPDPQGDVQYPRRKRSDHDTSIKERGHRPGYFDKSLADASRRRATHEERTEEIARRKEEREHAIADRERYKKALAKARTPGQNGQRRLGRESHLILEQVKRLVRKDN